MKNLYIDFDGVIMNTIEITYLELKGMNLDYNNMEDQEKIRDYYVSIDWNELLNTKASIINDGMDCIQKLINSNKFNISILSHVNSLNEAIEKVNFIRKNFKDITIIPVPRDISKTEMVHTEGAILVDDYAKNLEEWENAKGIGVKFDKDLDGKGFKVIDKLDQLLEIEI
ncbi:MAG TPA: hypothetical protein PLV83_01145 [Bacilli bacterium]|nr:hypothetical protein [Bacilli bacterium]